MLYTILWLVKNTSCISSQFPVWLTLYIFSQVNARYSNKTALHCAAAAGNANTVKLLLDYQAYIHAQVIDH